MTNREFSDYRSDIVLGREYIDEQTGAIGTATAIHFFQYACERVTIELMKKDGELMELTFDAPRLRENKPEAVPAATRRTGGPARAGEKRLGRVR
jgi:hypothetical protein